MTGATGLRRLCAVEDLPRREGRVVQVAGRTLAVFRCAAGIRVVDNTCPHAGGPLADGIVAGETVTCPLHNRVVDLITGRVSDCEDSVAVHPAVVEEGVVYLESPG